MCSLNVLLMRAPAEIQIHCKYTIHARCVGSDAHDLLRSTVSLGSGLGLGLGLGLDLGLGLGLVRVRVRVRVN